MSSVAPTEGSKFQNFIYFFFETEKGKNIQNKLNGFGAAIVVIGALFKILHLPGGSAVIGGGLITEALLFVIGAFEPVHMPVDWTRVYPQLADHPDLESAAVDFTPEKIEDSADNKEVIKSDSNAMGIVERIDEILSQANIDGELLSNFRESLYDFSMSTKKFAGAVDLVETQNDYSTQLNLASQKISELNSFYDKQIDLTEEQTNVSKEVLNNMSGTLKHQTEVQNELSDLVSNISSLNNVYGGMLSNIED